MTFCQIYNSQNHKIKLFLGKMFTKVAIFDSCPLKKNYQMTHYIELNPLPDDKILDRSKLKQSADNSFKYDENSRKFSKQVENTVGKGEIARYEQFLLFPQCFQQTCPADT